MTNLPSPGAISNSATTNAQQKTNLEALRDVVSELLGGGSETELTIASGTVTPPAQAAGQFKIDTEADAASDDLTTIAQTNTPEGRIIIIRGENPARVVTVKHATTGAGHIELAQPIDPTILDFVLDDVTKYLILMRVGTAWREIARSFGDDDAAHRSFYQIPTLPVSLTAHKELMVDAAGAQFVEVGPRYGDRNGFVNARADWWQRHDDDFSHAITAAEYVADRWRSDPGANGAATISRQAFALGHSNVPNHPKWYFRHDQTGASDVASNPQVAQRMLDVGRWSSQAVTVSVNAKADSAISVDVYAVQNFGTGGSPSSSVATQIGTINVTTGWARHSVSGTIPSIGGNTLGTDGNDYLAIEFRMPDNALFTFDWIHPQIEPGSVATPFVARRPGDELRECQRFYFKTFSQGKKPVQNDGSGEGAIAVKPGTSQTASASMLGQIDLPVSMRKKIESADVTTYGTLVANSQWSRADATSLAVELPTTLWSDRHIIIRNGATATAGSLYTLHVTIDQEL